MINNTHNQYNYHFAKTKPQNVQCEFDILCLILLLYISYIIIYVTYIIIDYMFIIVFAYKLTYYFIIFHIYLILQ
jgi:hypothetical protein